MASEILISSRTNSSLSSSLKRNTMLRTGKQPMKTQRSFSTVAHVDNRSTCLTPPPTRADSGDYRRIKKAISTRDLKSYGNCWHPVTSQDSRCDDNDSLITSRDVPVGKTPGKLGSLGTLIQWIRDSKKHSSRFVHPPAVSEAQEESYQAVNSKSLKIVSNRTRSGTVPSSLTSSDEFQNTLKAKYSETQPRRHKSNLNRRKTRLSQVRAAPYKKYFVNVNSTKNVYTVDDSENRQEETVSPLISSSDSSVRKVSFEVPTCSDSINHQVIRSLRSISLESNREEHDEDDRSSFHTLDARDYYDFEDEEVSLPKWPDDSLPETEPISPCSITQVLKFDEGDCSNNHRIEESSSFSSSSSLVGFKLRKSKKGLGEFPNRKSSS
ncbi:hypothetical protein CROQUDRAFT_136269 [Cronartium quercuum f. sp. fusiforme G11]|uniref:Uncharacterized protein n=1 Tax=Cronartium quercuum f. sp. fusiforme G11 TaxID=708437 RepID=A0A9P6T6T8_9BASI|nr:hypothetical protein CROQUDRAFT_136269 [Cronartium quercuum f. sp. fusiforme G11]